VLFTTSQPDVYHPAGSGQIFVEGERPVGTVCVLSDDRYLRQRMPDVLVRELERLEIAVRVVRANDVVARIGVDPWVDLAPGDVVVARTRNCFGLALLRAAERPGVKVLPRWESVTHVRNKARAVQTLAERGIPMPRTLLGESPAALKRLSATDFPLLLKPHLGDNASGIVLVRHPLELDDLAWPDGLVVAQEFVDSGSVDLKLYGVGDHLWAVRRPSPLAGAHAEQPAELADLTPELARIARACRDAFQLELYGVDVLDSPRGPLVVDVNEFPNYTGVAEAPLAIAELVRSLLTSKVAAQ
jgi:ribosomal protein S6--L-glutamate ligase